MALNFSCCSRITAGFSALVKSTPGEKNLLNPLLKPVLPNLQSSNVLHTHAPHRKGIICGLSGRNFFIEGMDINLKTTLHAPFDPMALIHFARLPWGHSGDPADARSHNLA